MAKAILIGAARSGAGKTVISTGLQRALSRCGHRVAGVKLGPDYIDPSFHTTACLRPSINLDGFAMPPDMLRGLAAHAADGVDLIVAEAAMGLYDGVAGSGRSSAAAVARVLDWPVVLVLDATATAQTLAAIANGLAAYPGAPRIAGAIANQIASARHARMIEDGFKRIGMPLLGLVPRDPRLILHSRHLGLVPASEADDVTTTIDAMADMVEAHCDIGQIAAAGTPVMAAPPPVPIAPPGQRIAVASDIAFRFLYPHLVEGWRRAGAEMRFFSPLADEPPPIDCDACWLPGGYPELHAARLAANRRFLGGLRAFNGPIHGECGGYMILGQGIVDAQGERHAMAALLPIETSFQVRKLQLGYRRITWREAMPFAAADATNVGHEFHHATLIGAEGNPIADAWDGEGNPIGPIGSRVGAVTGSFFHLVA